MVATKTVTGFELVQAAQEADLPWITDWFGGPLGYVDPDSDKPAKVSEACIMGQIAIKLGVSGPRLAQAIDAVTVSPETGEGYAGRIIDHNDRSSDNLEDAKEFAINLLRKIKDKTFSVPAREYFVVSTHPED